MRTTIKHGKQAGEEDRPRFNFDSAEDRELAARRIAALRSSTRGDAEDNELQALLDAMKRWDARYAAAPGQKDRP